MLKRISWKPNAVLSVKLREDLYTLAQMRENHLMQFFAIRNNNGQWHSIDLNHAKPVFCIYVAEGRIKPILESFVNEQSVHPSKQPIPRRMLRASPVVGSRYICTVDLIELDDSYEGLNAALLKENLVPSIDSEYLLQYELTGMWGSSEKLAKRLIRYFDTGVDWDDSKSFIFGDDLPPPSPQPSCL